MDQEKRDRYALQAPITTEMTMDACGFKDHAEMICSLEQRAVFFATRAYLAYEWADAMLLYAEDGRKRAAPSVPIWQDIIWGAVGLLGFILVVFGLSR